MTVLHELLQQMRVPSIGCSPPSDEMLQHRLPSESCSSSGSVPPAWGPLQAVDGTLLHCWSLKAASSQPDMSPLAEGELLLFHASPLLSICPLFNYSPKQKGSQNKVTSPTGFPLLVMLSRRCWLAQPWPEGSLTWSWRTWSYLLTGAHGNNPFPYYQNPARQKRNTQFYKTNKHLGIYMIMMKSIIDKTFLLKEFSILTFIFILKENEVLDLVCSRRYNFKNNWFWIHQNCWYCWRFLPMLQ